MTLYLLIYFDEDLPAVPSNAKWEYVDKKTWQALADTDVITELEDGKGKMNITRRRSYRLDELSGPKMVLQMDVKRENNRTGL
jgi:hypothetical protein